MIKLTWENVGDNNFMGSLAKLLEAPMGYDLGMRFALLGREIKKQKQLRGDTYDSILKKYGKPDKDKRGTYNIPPDKIEEYNEELKKLDAHTFDVKLAKFDAKKLSGVIEILPQDIMLLEPILLPLDVAEESTPVYEKAPTRPKPSEAAPNH